MAVAQPLNAAKQLSSFRSRHEAVSRAQAEGSARAVRRPPPTGPERDVAQRARLHIAMCDRRLQQATRQSGLRGRLLQLRRGADQLAEHRGGAHAPGKGARDGARAPTTSTTRWRSRRRSRGDVANAYENLKRAIELEPRNRIIARQDADFAPLANQPPFDVAALSGKEELVSGQHPSGRLSMEDISPLRVVAIGGGTGLSALLQGLKHYASRPTRRRRTSTSRPSSR